MIHITIIINNVVKPPGDVFVFNGLVLRSPSLLPFCQSLEKRSVKCIMNSEILLTFKLHRSSWLHKCAWDHCHKKDVIYILTLWCRPDGDEVPVSLWFLPWFLPHIVSGSISWSPLLPACSLQINLNFILNCSIFIYIFFIKLLWDNTHC